MKRLFFLLLVVEVLAPSLKAQQKSIPYVILISFDGFRHDYVKNFNPPNFKAFISKGSQAEAMLPSFPSKTFPNHYSIVTGLNPGHHGLVDNQFYDRRRHQLYGMKDKPKVVDPYYYRGIPLWQLAKQHGVKSASFFWVGSEMSDESRRPDYYFPFDDSVPPQARVDQALTWLALPESERPHLITLYFSFPDHEGHLFGPQAVETKHAVMKADSLLGNLLKGLQSINLPVNVILVSDHGMSELTEQPEAFIFFDELINKKDTSVIVVNGGTQAHLYIFNKTKRDSVYNFLKSNEKNFRIYRKEDFPDQWKYKAERCGDLLITAEPSHYLREGNWATYSETVQVDSKFGVHGYDPVVVSDMKGIFYAQGPNIKQGIMIPVFQNIHVYPLIAGILGLPIPPIDGDEKVLMGIYKK